MKIILWIGNEPNQKALANKLHDIFTITAVVTETRQSKTRKTILFIFEKIIEKLFLNSISKAWWGMLNFYQIKFPNYPNVPILDVENINSDKAFEFTANYQPDLILVSGTRLIKQKMLNLNPKIGILNLHTGLSPYVKGGPNCTNWCIAEKKFHLIGNTIMWIDKGIDTGNILTTELTELTGIENLSELHLKVMEHAHTLYLNSVKFLEKGNNVSIDQNKVAIGKTYYSKQWTLKQKMKLIKNYSHLKKQIINGQIKENQKQIKTFELN